MKITAVIGAMALGMMAPAVQAHGTAPHGDVGSDVKLDFDGAIPNIPGKSVKTVVVTYAPGGSSSPHTHAKSAFILAYVLEGEIATATNGAPEQIFKVGQHWTENPGDHHAVSYNPSKTKPAKLLAIFVVDTDDTQLTTPDPK